MFLRQVVYVDEKNENFLIRVRGERCYRRRCIQSDREKEMERDIRIATRSNSASEFLKSEIE